MRQPHSDPRLRALALANIGLATAALAAHLAEAETLDAQATAEQLFDAAAQILVTRHRPADQRILAEIGRWLLEVDEKPDTAPAPAPAETSPAEPAPPAPTSNQPWTWHPDPTGDLVLLDEAGHVVARIQTYRVPVELAADPEADEPYAGVWRCTVRRPGTESGIPGPPWAWTALDLAGAYRRVEAALGRPTGHWHHPATAPAADPSFELTPQGRRALEEGRSRR